jgi:predicted nucleotidyltransferase component of viral defense system
MVKKPLRLTISFSKDYEDVFHYLDRQENTSKFICELVRNEMKSHPKEETLEEKVYRLLQQYLENSVFLPSTDKLKTPNPTFQLKDEEIDLLNDLFG